MTNYKPISDAHNYKPILPVRNLDDVPMRLVTADGVERVCIDGESFLRVSDAALSALAEAAFGDVEFYLRPGVLDSYAAIAADESASENDRFVAASLLANAIISAEGELPLCQDTGTATICGTKGNRVLSSGNESAALSAGVAAAFANRNLRFSQVAPESMYVDANTKTNLPAQIDLTVGAGEEYKFLCVAKGGGSTNKTRLFMKDTSILSADVLEPFLIEAIAEIGTAACPPYRIGVVVGGTSPEANLKTLKLATCRDLESLPASANDESYAIRDEQLEATLQEACRNLGLGAQFGGVHFASEVRCVRLPRHAATVCVSVGVSCNADRNMYAKISADGVFVEQLDTNPSRYAGLAATSPTAIEISTDQPMDDLVAELARQPVGTMVLLSGPLVVARDAAHKRIAAMLDAGEAMPDALMKFPVYYAGPAKTPAGKPSGSFGPTTAQRMDSYVSRFQSLGASRVMLAKGNRSAVVAESCRENSGVYLGTIGGAAALVAARHITAVETIAFDDLGMEAIRKITVDKLPAFILTDTAGESRY